MMALEILHLEDNDSDCELVLEHLRSGGIEAHVVRVQTEEAFREQVRRPELDMILADVHCPGYDGFRALSLAREQRPELPFVFVSGTLPHREAIQSLQAGVTDYVPKDYLPRLVPVVRRVVQETQARLDLQSARETLLAQAELLDLANDSIILSDAAGTITYWNSGSQRIYGWEKEEAIGRNVHELLRTTFPATLPDLDTTLRKYHHWEGEVQQMRRDGTEIRVASHWTMKGSAADAPRLQINTDITAQKAAEEALRKSEERYRDLVDQDLTGNIVMRPDGTLITCNPAYVRIFGFKSTEAAMAANFFSLLRSRTGMAELISLVQLGGLIERHEMELRRADGEAVYVVARLVGTFAGDELTEVQVYLFNDTKRKRLEQQLIQAQKMEGLGTLAGGIAHDFNNILTIILGYTRQIENQRARPEQITAAAKVIKEAVERGAALVQQLLTSARQAEARLSSVDLNTMARELEKMLRATFPKMIEFELRLQPNFPVVRADRSQLHQVLLNLCVNARDAMPDGGTITIETGFVEGVQVAEMFAGADAERYACVRVQDTGTGMSPEVKAHIFEPFYTTKERSKGTGLGLSVVYGVVNNHHGFVQVESEPNAGTTFSIYLPAGQPQGQPGDAGSEQPPPGSVPKTILLVEDEEQLRDLGVEVLQGEGYRVITAADGIEAVEQFTAHCDEIGLVICDLGLPRLGGRDAFMRMKEVQPTVRAIVASGYLEPALRSEILKAGVIDTIQKPYDFGELIEKIRAVLGKAQTDDDHPRLF